MEIDLFEKEQKIYDNAVNLIENVRKGTPFNFEDYEKITQEYGKLLKHLRRSVRFADMTTAGLHKSNLDLTDKIHYDVLTGIYNRRFLEESLQRIIKTLARSDGKLGLLMIDIDFFKNYNDTYGHSEGDNCLKAVAKALAESLLRADDFVARYGGEEFAVILPNTGENGACVTAEKILENVRALNIPHEKSEAASCVTVSIGVTTGDVKQTQTGDEYIRHADKALYMSKQSGRNRYTSINFKEDEE